MENKEEQVWSNMVDKEIQNNSEKIKEAEKIRIQSPVETQNPVQINDYLQAKASCYENLLANLYDLITEYLNCSDFRKVDLPIVRKRLQQCLDKVAPLFLERVKERGKEIVDSK